jgi:hypothetical protein
MKRSTLNFYIQFKGEVVLIDMNIEPSKPLNLVILPQV